jgi:hypothetical protein
VTPATLDARRTLFLGIQHATFELAGDGRVIQHCGTPSGVDVTAEYGGPLDSPAALRAAVTAQGWEVSS